MLSKRQGGAVIVVVLTLLASLAFLGFFFYSWSDQEAKSARAFAFERLSDDETDGLNILDDALQQIILATPDTRPQSALHGGQISNGVNPTFNVSDKSMLAHLLGLIRSDGTPEDVRPRNGTGIAVYGLALDANGMPIANTAFDIAFDYDGDNAQDADGTNFRLNTSAAANVPGGAAPFERFGTPLENSRPDVDYTYPDVNAQFIAYDAVLPGGQRVQVPSFLRPQLFPNKRAAGFGDLYTDPATAGQVLRPHSEHRNSDGSLRYIDPVSWPVGRPALSGDLSRVIAPFPFTVDANTNATDNEMGVFSNTAQYDLDADADGDGILDSIWLDLDYPIIDLEDGRQVVPMFYTKIIDLDALLNVNHHGHAPLFTQLSNNAAADAFTHIYGLNVGGIHASNLGLSPAEVSLLPALRADPNDVAYLDAFNFVAATQQHRGWYADQSTGPPTDRTGGVMSRLQMANTELARLLYGSPQYDFDLSLSSPNPASDIPGRYGETFVGGTPLLRNALGTPGSGVFPSAGDTTVDDDGDDNNSTVTVPPGLGNDGPVAPGDNLATGIVHVDTFDGLLTPGLLIPPSVHPLDFTGLGNYAPLSSYYGFPYGASYRIATAGVGAQRDLSGRSDAAAVVNPSSWVLYGTQVAGAPQAALWSNQDSGGGPVFGILPWTRAGGVPGDLQVSQFPLGTPYDGLWNENDEIVTDGSFPTAVDQPFPVSESPAVQLSNADWLLASSNSRLRKLASFNLETNKQAESIRRQFTTDSRDRLEHGHSLAAMAEDANLDGVLDPNEDDGPGGAAPPDDGDGFLEERRWELNDTLFAPNEPRFPPAFNGITSRHEGLNPTVPAGSPPVIDDEDPFRPVVRRLLTVEQNNRFNIGGNRYLAGQRLNLNRLLVNFDRNGNPIYRHLTPHATFQLGDTDGNNYLIDGTPGGIRPVNHAHAAAAQSYYDDGQSLALLDADIPSPVSAPTYQSVPFSAITTNRFAQEAWARYDRQRLARDIYVLLYTLGGPDNLNPTTTLYPVGADTNGNGISDFVDAMAQFAVNYVDALDQDDVVTRFEYDGNLSDGWNNPPGTLGVVHGVETQQLAFSEVLLVQQPGGVADNTGTLHNESSPANAEHRWLYVELRNATPFAVPLPTGSYRLARYAQNETGRTGTLTPVAASEFRTPTAGSPKQVLAGENFIVACHDGLVTNAAGVPLTSDFYADIDGATPGLEAVIPENATVVAGTNDDPTMTANAPHADLDLIVTTTMVPSYDEFYSNTIPAPGGVSLVEPDLVGLGTPVMFQLRLERRLNTNGFGFGENDGTWVEVDRTEVTGQQFTPAGNTPANMTTALANVASTERRQVFDNTEIQNADVTIRKHSMVSGNGVSLVAKHTGNWAWGSVNGGDRTAAFTLWQPHFNRDFSSVYELLSVPVVSPERLISDLADVSTNRMSGWSDSTVVPSVPFTASGIFEHPDGQTPGVAADDNRWYRLFEFVEFPPRTHDTIRDNLTLRRRTEARINLNTLRHEANLAGLIDDETQLDTLANPSRPTSDRHDPGARNWFDQLLAARDGVDPFTGLSLPGVPGALPFRSMSFIQPQNPNLVIRSTLLRPHRPSGAPSDNLQLFEARGTADIGSDSIDYHTRNRLLAKIANNTTNRSHVFAVWVGYELFEAHQPNLPAQPDVVQIGAKITDIPGHRDFCVVDMTRLEEAFVDDPNDVDTFGNPVPGRFDWRKFIIYRKQIK